MIDLWKLMLIVFHLHFWHQMAYPARKTINVNKLHPFLKCWYEDQNEKRIILLWVQPRVLSCQFWGSLPQLYMQLVYKATFYFTLRIQIMSGSRKFLFNCQSKNYIFLTLMISNSLVQMLRCKKNSKFHFLLMKAWKTTFIISILEIN